MSRYIDAEKIIGSLTNTIQEAKKWRDNAAEPIKTRANGAIDAFTECVMRIKEISTADMEEVKHGKWVRNDNGTYSCNRCQSWIPNEQRHYARYCLYCGAKMDKEKEE